jgi:hypothetical protein
MLFHHAGLGHQTDISVRHQGLELAQLRKQEFTGKKGRDAQADNSTPVFRPVVFMVTS